jgi:signal transduction histidine kinase
LFSISITDQGIGIPDDEKKHLFERFFRASNVTAIQGTGLGLHIVKKYLELLNGNIWFESTYGVGSTFYVSIPV